MAINDIMIYETLDGGDLKLENGDIVTTEGLSNQAYLGLFGGNLRGETTPESGAVEDRGDYWGNVLKSNEPNEQYNSKTEQVLRTIVLNTSGLSAIENAVNEDMAYLFPYADVTVIVELTAPNRVDISVNIIEPDGQSTKQKFIWDGTKNTTIHENPNI